MAKKQLLSTARLITARLIYAIHTNTFLYLLLKRLFKIAKTVAQEVTLRALPSWPLQTDSITAPFRSLEHTFNHCIAIASSFPARGEK